MSFSRLSWCKALVAAKLVAAWKPRGLYPSTETNTYRRQHDSKDPSQRPFELRIVLQRNPRENEQQGDSEEPAVLAQRH